MTFSIRAAGTPGDDAQRTRPAGLADIRRESLVNSLGVRYSDFRRQLVPHYGLLWAQLLCGHAMLLVITATMALALHGSSWLVPWLIVGGSVAYGYLVAYVVLFFHEAAHYNLLPRRDLNDRFANILIGIFVGQAIDDYRPVHFDHHRDLGTPDDPEHAYFDPLDVRFLVELLTGVKTTRRLLERGQGTSSSRGQILVSLLFHAMVIAAAVLTGYWPVAVAWIVGMVIFFPFFAALRQLLEHRNYLARSDVDYRVVPHGAVTRLFGSGPLASTLGAAGFNRHLLHHWDPQVPSTRLSQLETFLLDTAAADILREANTTYCRAFSRLFANTRTR
jgi:fatty acid desaturase